MRVMQLVPTLGIGGAERVAGLLARELARAGHAVCVVSEYDPRGTWIEGELRGAGVELRFLGKRRGLDLRMIPRIARELLRFRPDVLHTHTDALKYALPAIAARPRCRIVHTVHNLAEREAARPAERLVRRVAFRAGVVPVAIGHAVAASLRRRYGVRAAPTIPNGIPVRDYAPDEAARREVRAALGIDVGAPVFLAVGRLMAQKNHAGLLRAFASARLRERGARLLVAGEGELRDELLGLARALGVDERVRFLGARPDVPRLLAAADAFVLASEWEGNPLAVLEAMAAGRAVVATAVGCVPELVSERTGLLAPPGDERALEEALHAVARDPGAARELGREGARVARERFDVAVMARGYAELYRDVARGGEARAARARAAHA
jgi:glycosyltransferase involved in cell wall biosynthesis